MRRYWQIVALGLALTAAGCNSGGGPDGSADPPEVAPRPERPLVSLAELLTKPRQELAAEADDLAANLRVQEKAHRDGQLTYPALADLRLPLVIPVLHEARYSAAAGFSLPPYAAANGKDSALALHLARHGDTEAARRLADPADADTLRRIDEARGARNYPVEWTRLAGLLLHQAQVQVALGEDEGGKRLAALHQQVKGLLDPKAAKGPLGADLLPRGHRVLTLAETTWRAQKRDGADAAREALAAWGDLPVPALVVPLGATRADTARLIPGESKGRTLAATSPGRALDLFGIPLPADHADAVVSFFDAAGKLSEVLVVYGPRAALDHPQPGDLAFLLQEPLKAVAEPVKEPGLRRCGYQVGGLSCDATLVGRNGSVGGLVRLHGGKPVGEAPVLPRDLGGLRLDQTFEQNRVRLAPEQRGPTVETGRAEALAIAGNPLPALKPVRVVVQAEAGQDVTAGLALRYDGAVAVRLAEGALPLWATWGPGRLEGVDDEQGGHLAWVWEDAQTRWELQLPNSTGESPALELRDRRGAGEAERRAAAAAALERSERKARLAAGKPLARLPRFVEWEAVQLDKPRDQVLIGLPVGRSVLTRDVPGGVTVTFAGEPAKGAKSVLRQLLLHFGADNRLTEARARYEDVSGKGTAELLAGFKKRCGAPAETPGPWAAVWPELPVRKPAPTLASWQDDLTFLSVQSDGAGAEVALRHRPPEDEAAAALEYLPHGPDGCALGDARDELLRRWKVTQPVTVADGATVLTPDKGSPYDALLVYFDGGRVNRVVARHAVTGAGLSKPAEVADAISAAWGRDLRTLGWPRRQDAGSAGFLEGLGWHDERTRVRLFAAESAQGGPRLYTEWRRIGS